MIVILFSSNMINVTKAQTEIFSLKDGFEDYINNRIYTEYYNDTYIDFAETILSDAWDFTEDTDGFSAITGCSVNWNVGGFLEVWNTTNPDSFIFGVSFASIDEDIYDKLEIRLRTNSTETLNIFGLRNQINNYFWADDYPTNEKTNFTSTYTTMIIDLDNSQRPPPIAWNSTDQTEIRFTITSTSYPNDFATAPTFVFVDYVKVFKTVNEQFITQNTTSYRATKGLKSYLYDFPNYYYNFTTTNGSSLVYYNSSIKIDVPSLDFFPEKIYFNIYSNVVFNLSMYIGATEYLLHQEETYLDDWSYLRETIDREDFILNDTEDEIYFEIYTFRNETETIYIDELEITYTESVEEFDVYVGTHTGTNLSFFDYNASSHNFRTENSGEYITNFNQHTRGIFYATESNELFTRRMFHTYNLELSGDDCNDVYFNLFQNATFGIDKTYEIVLEFAMTVVDVGGTDYVNVDCTQIVLIDGIQKYYTSEYFNDYYLSLEMFMFEINTRIVQEDINTISISCDYRNVYTGNTTAFEPISFVTNSKYQTSLNTASVTTNASFYPVLNNPFPPSWFPSDTDITLKIKRDITHSLISGELDTFSIPDRPIFDAGNPIRSLFQIIGYWISLALQQLLSAFSVGSDVNEMLEQTKVFFSTTTQSITGIGNSLSTATGTLGNIFGLLGSSFTSIISNLGNIWGFLSGSLTNFITNFFTNIISPFTGAWTDEQSGFPFLTDWIDVSSDYAGSGFEGTVNSFNDIFLPTPLLWTLLENTGDFWNDFFGMPIPELIITIYDMWQSFIMWLTILIIIYIVHLCQLLIRRDWDRLRREITSIVNIIVGAINGVVKIIHWIFEVIWALLDVLIPFT